jgi:hypothetical protein
MPGQGRVLQLQLTWPHHTRCTQVCCELGQHESLAFLDPLGSLLDGCSADAAAVAVTTPPFMSGAVLVPSVLDSLTCQVGRPEHSRTCAAAAL